MNKQQLAQKIWASANQMRSKIEASEYKDFILGFIFYKYLADNIKYPPILIKIKLEGSLDLKFTINTEGKVNNIEITRGFDPDADNEVLRVMRSMPIWTPAKENGVAVNYTHHLTVTFT